jgi:nudix-type nucleoside diphosphatase (YffH/AdpP family)
VLIETGATSFLEIMAGLSDGQPPEHAARREASEETGLKLRALQHVAQVWTMPGLSTERMDVFLAEYAEADRVGQGGGAEGEHENIIVVELPLAELAAMADGGQIADMKTLALLQTLRLQKPGLFEG